MINKRYNYDLLSFILSIVCCVFWIISRTINVYQYKILGAFFELAFLPMLILFFVLPFLLLVQVFKTKTNLKTYSLVALLIQFITILFLTTRD